jgi:hypothetical protein
LLFTVTNVDDSNLTRITVAIGQETVTSLPGVNQGETITYFVQIPSSVEVLSGQSYSILLYTEYANGPGPTLSLSVQAT